jgi:hypothetical protein
MKRVAPAVLFVLLLTGCGGDNDSSEPSDSCEPQSGATVAAKGSPVLQDRPTMYLTGVEAAGGDCVERVTFRFKPSTAGPGYDASYQPADVAKIEDGSGNPFAIEGEEFLVVRMFPAMTATINGENVQPTYDGPRRIPAPPDATMIREVGMSGNFEAQLTWVIGLDAKRPFRVTASKDALVVELSNVDASP